MREWHLGLETPPLLGTEEGLLVCLFKIPLDSEPMEDEEIGSHLPLGPQAPMLGTERSLGSTFQMGK